LQSTILRSGPPGCHGDGGAARERTLAGGDHCGWHAPFRSRPRFGSWNRFRRTGEPVTVRVRATADRTARCVRG
jgi:hypothetical protein